MFILFPWWIASFGFYVALGDAILITVLCLSVFHVFYELIGFRILWQIVLIFWKLRSAMGPNYESGGQDSGFFWSEPHCRIYRCRGEKTVYKTFDRPADKKLIQLPLEKPTEASLLHLNLLVWLNRNEGQRKVLTWRTAVNKERRQRFVQLAKLVMGLNTITLGTTHYSI